VIGADRGEQLSIHVTRREFPEASDYWDGNWVYATIRIRAGAFRGEYEALVRTDELASFRDSWGRFTPRSTDPQPSKRWSTGSALTFRAMAVATF
jgi:hypothetical protein